MRNATYFYNLSFLILDVIICLHGIRALYACVNGTLVQQWKVNKSPENTQALLRVLIESQPSLT